ncbi:MAG: hypothetical protein ACYDG2_24260 [Ruminiclostridium sp.]
MALVKKLVKISKNSRLQAEAECTYNIIVEGGEKYMQINTYGSSERVNKNVASQTLQFNQQSASQLFDILKKEFVI